MRVLMFGWEFPPHIAGGLGTACEGIVKGLAYNGVETLFVMPSASGDEDQSATTIINASDVAVDTVSAKPLSSFTGRSTEASVSEIYSCTTSAPATLPVFFKMALTLKPFPERITPASLISNVV